MIRALFITASLTALSLPSLSQDTEREKVRQLEQQKMLEKDRRVKQEIDSGVYHMDRGEYEIADAKFRSALSNLKSIPSDLAFFFGKNSYLLGKHKQGVDWLTKYIQLKGTSGQYSTEAAEWLKKSEEAVVAEHKTQASNAVEILSRDYQIDCGPSGKVTCPVCSGTTVIVKRDYLQGQTYKTCPYCSKHGFLSCEDYNLLIRGQLKATVSK